jgi:hypothetical protein
MFIPSVRAAAGRGAVSVYNSAGAAGTYIKNAAAGLGRKVGVVRAAPIV